MNEMRLTYSPDGVVVDIPADTILYANGKPLIYNTAGQYTVRLTATPDMIEKGQRIAAISQAIRVLKKYRGEVRES